MSIRYGHYAYSEEEIKKCNELEKFIAEHDGLFDLNSFDTMVEMAIHHLKDGNINVASHIVDALQEKVAEYYRYDVTMGTLETPVPIDNTDELKAAYPEIFEEDNR